MNSEKPNQKMTKAIKPESVKSRGALFKSHGDCYPSSPDNLEILQELSLAKALMTPQLR